MSSKDTTDAVRQSIAHMKREKESLGQQHIEAVLTEFLDRHPEVESIYGIVTVDEDDHAVDFYELFMSDRDPADDARTVDRTSRFLTKDGEPILDDAGFPTANPHYGSGDASFEEIWGEDDFAGEISDDLNADRIVLSERLKQMEDIIETFIDETSAIRMTRTGMTVIAANEDIDAF